MPRVVVIGAGAAGTMAAIFAASAGAETVLVERTNDGGRKILISGGGRCNILPAQLDESRFITDSPAHLVRRIVRSWPLARADGRSSSATWRFRLSRSLGRASCSRNHKARARCATGCSPTRAAKA